MIKIFIISLILISTNAFTKDLKIIDLGVKGNSNQIDRVYASTSSSNKLFSKSIYSIFLSASIRSLRVSNVSLVIDSEFFI